MAAAVADDCAALVAAAQAGANPGFAAASRRLAPPWRQRVWLLYGWWQACQSMVDAAPSPATLARIEALTAMALAQRPTGLAGFDALARLADLCPITIVHTGEVLVGWGLQAAGWQPAGERDCLGQCYHTAGAMGVLGALALGVDRHDHDTLDRACDWAMGWRLAGLARAGGAAGLAPARLMALAAPYLAAGRMGVGRLPWRARWAIESLVQGGGAGAWWRAWGRHPVVPAPPLPRGALAGLGLAAHSNAGLADAGAAPFAPAA